MPKMVKICTFAQKWPKYAFAYENMQFHKIRALMITLYNYTTISSTTPNIQDSPMVERIFVERNALGSIPAGNFFFSVKTKFHFDTYFKQREHG